MAVRLSRARFTLIMWSSRELCSARPLTRASLLELRTEQTKHLLGVCLAASQTSCLKQNTGSRPIMRPRRKRATFYNSFDQLQTCTSGRRFWRMLTTRNIGATVLLTWGRLGQAGSPVCSTGAKPFVFALVVNRPINRLDHPIGQSHKVDASWSSARAVSTPSRNRERKITSTPRVAARQVAAATTTSVGFKVRTTYVELANHQTFHALPGYSAVRLRFWRAAQQRATH